jgi:RimJ/RimL family protein N-acetyltransferase
VIELAGSRVRLRPPTLDDVDALAAAVDADPSTVERTSEEARDRLRERVERKPTLEHDGFLGLVVEHESSLVGDIQARAPMHGMPPGGCEIGVSLFPESRGLGIGREAVALLTSHLLDGGFHRVQATTATANSAMRHVLEHVGYTFEGTLRDYGPTAGGGREDYAMYSFTARDRASAE